MKNKSILNNTAVQSQKAASAYFTGKQILCFGFEEQYSEHNISCVFSFFVK